MSPIKYPKVPITPGIVRSEFSLWELESRVFSPEFGHSRIFSPVSTPETMMFPEKIVLFDLK
jgi:hypothetical protein